MKYHPNYIKVLENYYKDISYKDFIKKYPDSEEFVTKGLSIKLMDRRSFYDHEKDKSEPLKIILVNIGSEGDAFDVFAGSSFDLMHFKFNNDIVECKPVFRSRLSYNAKIQLFEVFLYEKFKGHEYLNYFFEKGNSMHRNDIRIVEERYNNYLADLNYKGTSKKMGDDYESYNNWIAKMRMGDDFESFNYWISKHEFHHELLKSFIQGHKYAEFKNTDDKPFKFSNDYFPEFFKELDLFFREDISVGLPYQFYQYEIQLDNHHLALSRDTGFIMDEGQVTGFHHSQMDIELLNPISGEWRDVYIDMRTGHEGESIDSKVLDFPTLKLHLENIKKYGKK